MILNLTADEVELLKGTLMAAINQNEELRSDESLIEARELDALLSRIIKAEEGA